MDDIKRSADTLPALDWEDIRSFLETGRRGSFSAAATRLGISINSVRRRVAQLERAVSHQLLTRGPDGIHLTEHGVQIMAMARKMEDSALELLASAGLTGSAQVQIVKFAVQDTLGPLWLVPRLNAYRQLEPKTVVEMMSGFRASEILKLDADVSLHIGRAPGPELKSVRLGRIHSVPTVGSAFLKSHRLPASLEELKKHPLALLDRSLSVQMFARVFPGLAPEELVRLKTNNSIIQLLGVLSGGGVAWMPSYVHAVVRDLHVVPIDRVFSSDIWLSRRKSSVGIACVDNLWNWTIESFDQESCPWFNDGYIPPSTFAGQYRGFRLSLA